MFKGEKFRIELFLSATGLAANSGLNAASPKPFAAGDLMNIPAGMLIERAFVVVDAAIAGTTNLDVGDDDDADGLVDGSLTGSVNAGLATPGVYGWPVSAAGAYMKTTGADASDTVQASKYYAAAGKEIKLAVSGTNSAGRARVVIEGTMLAAK